MASRIDSYEFGRIKIEGRVYNQDLIIGPDCVLTDWRRKQGHSLLPDDLARIMELGPETIIIGSGASGLLKVPDKTREWIEKKGIKLIILPTREACHRYNKMADAARVVAGLHLTC